MSGPIRIDFFPFQKIERVEIFTRFWVTRPTYDIINLEEANRSDVMNAFDNSNSFERIFLRIFSL